ncbi:MAG TPA: 50S ribosomal protein L9 [Planctomycetota bacterium]|nr:50S ribosomal protein L9 [Planctomycetota bacterium]HRT94556.1 50S ribosomal protein L9 [Planctomycetota bacterium]
MQILLRKDHESLGKAGEVVNVSTGFARNYLFPRKIATPVTADNLQRLEAEKRRAQREAEKRHQAIVEAGKRLEAISCTIAAQATETGTLFGSVGAAQIAAALRQEGFEVPEDAVRLEHPIKETGVYAIEIQLAPDVVAATRIWVVAD